MSSKGHSLEAEQMLFFFMKYVSQENIYIMVFMANIKIYKAYIQQQSFNDWMPIRVPKGVDFENQNANASDLCNNNFDFAECNETPQRICIFPYRLRR